MILNTAGYIQKKGWPDNPAESFSLPRPEKHLPETLGVEEVRILFESIEPSDPPRLP